MASFFTDVFDAFTGQQATPQQTIIPTDQLLSQSYGDLNSQVAPGLVAFNQALAPGLTDVQLGVSNQLDPSILGNLRGANRSILDQLNLGSALGQELQEDVIRNALEGVTSSGFGGRNLSEAGTGLVARDLGITGLDLLRRRQQDALSAGQQGTELAQSFYDPLQYTQMGAIMAKDIGQDIRGIQAAKDELANLTEDIRRQNFSSLLNTGGRIAGSVIGGIYGGPMGAQVGGKIGGSFISGSRVAGQQTPQAGSGGGGGFGSILSGLGGGGSALGGPQYGIGGGGGFTGDIGGGSFGGYA